MVPTSRGETADLTVLIQRLDDPTLAGRELAERQILAMGPTVLAELPREEAIRSAETRLRIQRIRRQLEVALSVQAAGASRVTLTARDRPLGEILEAIRRQTGNAVRVRPAALASHPVSPVFEATPFWEAVDRLAGECGAIVTCEAADRSVLLVGRPHEGVAPPIAVGYQGPFRFALGRLEQRADPARPGASVLGATMEVLWEPRVRPIRLTLPMAQVQAEAWYSRGGDRRRAPLECSSPKAVLEIPCDATTIARDIRLHFRASSRVAVDSVALTGALNVLACGPTRRFRLDDLRRETGRPQRAGEATVQLVAVQEVERGWEIQLAVRFDRAYDAFASHRTWFYQNGIGLVDASNKILPGKEMRLVRQYADGVRLAFLFSGNIALDGAQVLYESPIAIQSRELVFRIEPRQAGVPVP